ASPDCLIVTSHTGHTSAACTVLVFFWISHLFLGKFLGNGTSPWMLDRSFGRC
ncbi:MAG: hypothetical protein JWN45_1230, partial [Acidobacteriaceae bacterium]|nr:hypothetical protein [Acidobacteriaceae bacterium]